MLSLPEMNGRYYLMPMLDAWTHVFRVPGKRTTGTGPQNMCDHRPGLEGDAARGSGGVPAAHQHGLDPRSKSNRAALRKTTTRCNKIQDQLALVPLGAYGKPYAPPPGKVDPSVDMKTPVRDQVDKMDTTAYFGVMTEALKRNLPAAVDAPMIERIAKIGIVPGQDFDASKLPAGFAIALKAVPKLAHAKIMGHVRDAGALENGWIVTTRAGQYGTEYLQRATVAAIGLGANLLHSRMWCTRPRRRTPTAATSSGAHRYVVHFDKGMEPPVKAFWSLTMYDEKYFFVANPLNRFTLSQRDKFTTNPDGSIDLYHAEREPRRRQGSQLAAGAGEQVHSDDADVLANRHEPVDPSTQAGNRRR